MSRCRFDEIDYGDEMQVVENYVYKVDKIYFVRNSRQVGNLVESQLIRYDRLCFIQFKNFSKDRSQFFCRRHNDILGDFTKDVQTLC